MSPTSLHPKIAEVTDTLRERSRPTRTTYLEQLEAMRTRGAGRARLSAANLAHGVAAAAPESKSRLRLAATPSIAIVTSYNDVLSAHAPYVHYPEELKAAVASAGGVAMVAGGVPAMCDGVTQGNPGMELSLMSREVIAMGTAIALSHDLFDGALYLGVCDKIVPGLVIGALAFGHLPGIFVPAGPMTSGLPNAEKSRVRELYAQGKVDDAALFDAEARAYHGLGTCTFYGTANSNQLLMEMLGLHLPGAAFVPTETPLRSALTRRAGERIVEIAATSPSPLPIGRLLDERSFVNAVVGLLATGGSTNHTLHLVAMARAAGIQLTWQDFDALSRVVPLVARVYPNGGADINAFHQAGGTSYLIGALLAGGLLHDDVETIAGPGLSRYAEAPTLEDDALSWHAVRESRDPAILRPATEPFADEGGLRMLEGDLGRAVMKISAVAPEHHVVEAPARIFDSQEALQDAFHRDDLPGDFVAVVRFQGPRANGMPELHRLTPVLASLQGRGQKVALVTDGRMSGASGKVPAAIHLTPEATVGGPIARLRDGDLIRLDAALGRLEVKIDRATWETRTPASPPSMESAAGWGRELFAPLRRELLAADEGAGLPRL